MVSGFSCIGEERFEDVAFAAPEIVERHDNLSSQRSYASNATSRPQSDANRTARLVKLCHAYTFIRIFSGAYALADLTRTRLRGETLGRLLRRDIKYPCAPTAQTLKIPGRHESCPPQHPGEEGHGIL